MQAQARSVSIVVAANLPYPRLSFCAFWVAATWQQSLWRYIFSGAPTGAWVPAALEKAAGLPSAPPQGAPIVDTAWWFLTALQASATLLAEHVWAGGRCVYRCLCWFLACLRRLCVRRPVVSETSSVELFPEGEILQQHSQAKPE